ncbi:CENP-Q, a CENPA-CAD centromere complex subunit-domain-containing protein [Xylaria grammica]|nr:CENP-Q, a CENPA-CAD centromere complex subunit-domain-containing protein [Xylaria grammica]
MDPPPAANQKRKRGRRANASRDDEARDASNSTAQAMSQTSRPEANGEVEDGDNEGLGRPRKRNRRTKDHVPQEPQPESSTTQRNRRGRRQPPTAQMEAEPAEQTGRPVPSEGVKTTKRGRPKKGDQRANPPELEAEEADDENEEGNSSLLRRSKRHRPSLDEPPVPPENRTAQGEEVESSAAQQAAKKRKRSVRAKDKEQPREEAEPEAEAEATSRTKRWRGKRHPPLQDTQGSMNGPDPEAAPEPEPVLPQKRRGRPPRPEGGDGNSSIGLQSRLSQGQKETAAEGPQKRSRQRQSNEAHRKSKPRRRPSEEQDRSPSRSSSPASVSSPPPYRHITERKRRVTHNTIASKWSSLEPASASVANFASLLHSISLPTLQHVVPKQYGHAEEVLEKVIRGLCKKSTRTPFPPTSTLPHREDELDFEKTQSAVEVLLSQLDPLQHSVELLRREKERVEKDLEREYKVLDRLSTNARAEARERRDRLRKVHVLVPETNYGSAANRIDLLPADKASSQVFTSIQDQELLNLAGQINNHMESMRGNLQQIDGVLPAIAKSHALLRTTLQPQFSQGQLEDILLGQTER